MQDSPGASPDLSWGTSKLDGAKTDLLGHGSLFSKEYNVIYTSNI